MKENVAEIATQMSTALLSGNLTFAPSRTWPTSLRAEPCPRTVMRTLKRHLSAAHGLTPALYRERWTLDPDYPMTAKNYATRRSQLAKAIGLGRRTSSRRAGP